MSALGSSVINKSSIKIKPKAAPTRRAPASTATSARVSVDRQGQSEIEQAQSSLLVTASSSVPVSSISDVAPTTLPQVTTAAHASAQNVESVLQNAQIGSEEEPEPLVSSASRKRPHQPGAVAISIPRARLPPVRRDAHSNFPVNGLESATPAARARQPSPSIQPISTSGDDEPANELLEQPPAKRRRIQGPDERIPPVQRTSAQADEPIPTTETSEGGRGTPTPETPIVTPPPPQLSSEPIRTSIELAPASNRTGITRLSAKAKGKQRATEEAAADVVLNAARGCTEQDAGRAHRRTRRASGADKGARSVDVTTKEREAEPKEKRKKRKKREVTPENAEDVRIDPSAVLMSELTKNLRTGRKSGTEAKLQEMDQEAKAKRKQRRIDKRNGVATEEPENDDAPIETTDERLERLAPQANETRHAHPNQMIVNGQIVIDEDSLLIDRHAEAAAQRNAEPPVVVEENNLSRRVTQASWGKRDKSGGWNELLTDQFYDGLRMFGTDFNMISKMFPGRTRHSVKLKFNKEERDDPVRLERALKGERMPVDMVEFQKMTNTVYGDPKELEKELEEDKKRIEEEEAAARAALDEVTKQRADDAAAEAEAADREVAENSSSTKENQDTQAGAEEEGEPASQVKEVKRKRVRKQEPTARQRNKAQNKVVKKAADTGSKRVKRAKNALGIGATIVPGL